MTNFTYRNLSFTKLANSFSGSFVNAFDDKSLYKENTLLIKRKSVANAFNAKVTV